MTTSHPGAWLPFGSITDVDGITVGHAQRTGRGWQTGTTVIVCERGATPGVDVRGGGPGTRETDAIHPQNLVQEVHGICLTGGSAFGLSSAHGLMEWLEAKGLGFPVGASSGVPQVVPVVPAAVIFDLGRGGVGANRPDATFGLKAAKNARRRQLNWGSVGAGTGARAGGLQGGVGTASTTVRIVGRDAFPTDVEVTVGALAVTNPNGAVISPSTGLPWELSGLTMKRPPRHERDAMEAAIHRVLHGGVGSLNTTIGVVATTARLGKAETSKLASVAHDGMARAVRPAHSMTDGDTVFGLATGLVELPDVSPSTARHAALNQLLAAAADTFAAACTHAVLAATTVGSAAAYREVCPSALR